jgi:guanine deaminase
MDPREYMLLAVARARKTCAKGEGGPFGACVVRKGKIVAIASNQVLRRRNAIWHAEMRAITEASRRLKTHELKDCEIYSTTEPCVMCFAAINWAKIRKVYFGTTVPDVKRLGFNELTISNKTLKRLGRSRVRIEAGFCRRECSELLDFWKRLPKKRTY